LRDRILLVEDEVAIADFTAKTLYDLGYEFAGTAWSGEEAVQSVRRNKPALVLMDIGLKGSMDGVEAARRIRLDQDIPVVFLTAADDELTLAHAKTAEPLGYIVKPFESRNLHAAIEIALSQHKNNQKLTKAALRKAEERFRLKFENAVAGMFQASNDGEFMQANWAFARILGYESPEDLTAAVKNVCQVLNVDIDPVQKLASFCQNPDTKKKFELQAYRKDGSTIWVSGAASAVRDSNGGILYFEGSIMDVTAPKKEPALKI
jgi:PAS domain S-box-containing protein